MQATNTFLLSETKQKKLVSFDAVFATLNALPELINSWIMKLEGLVYCFNKLYCLFESFKSLTLSFSDVYFHCNLDDESK